MWNNFAVLIEKEQQICYDAYIPEKNAGEMPMRISSREYGITAKGEHVTCYTMVNANRMKVECINYGCILTHLWVPDRQGHPVDIVLGYDNLHSYEEDDSLLGCLVGPVANRIKNARFTLDGKPYELEANDGVNHLNGVLEKRVFHAYASGGSVCFTYRSPDGEDGMPGNVDFSITYTLDDNNVLSLKYEAVSDADTILNLTNHSYFNLAGHASGTVDSQLLQIAADQFLETTDDACPTGQMLPVEGTAMDFRTLRHIGQGFPIREEQLELVGGYDHCYCLRADAAPAALVYAPATGIAMSLMTSQPGLQFYSGNDLGEGLPGKEGVHYTQRAGFCLETEHYPCAASFPAFPSIEVKAGTVYEELTLLQFQALESL